MVGIRNLKFHTKLGITRCNTCPQVISWYLHMFQRYNVLSKTSIQTDGLKTRRFIIDHHIICLFSFWTRNHIPKSWDHIDHSCSKVTSDIYTFLQILVKRFNALFSYRIVLCGSLLNTGKTEYLDCRKSSKDHSQIAAKMYMHECFRGARFVYITLSLWGN